MKFNPFASLRLCVRSKLKILSATSRRNGIKVAESDSVELGYRQLVKYQLVAKT
jgi:hypothetical protein